MIDIKFKVNGRDVSAHSIEDALEAAVIGGIKEEIRRKLGHVRCPEHRQPPRVTASGPSVERLKVSVQGCCERLIEQAEKALQ